jgi:hypothetical protein
MKIFTLLFTLLVLLFVTPLTAATKLEKVKSAPPVGITEEERIFYEVGVSYEVDNPWSALSTQQTIYYNLPQFDGSGTLTGADLILYFDSSADGTFTNFNQSSFLQGELGFEINTCLYANYPDGNDQLASVCTFDTTGPWEDTVLVVDLAPNDTVTVTAADVGSISTPIEDFEAIGGGPPFGGRLTLDGYYFYTVNTSSQVSTTGDLGGSIAVRYYYEPVNSPLEMYLMVLSQWGPCEGGCAGDLNEDGVVDGLDLLIVLADW